MTAEQSCVYFNFMCLVWSGIVVLDEIVNFRDRDILAAIIQRKGT